MADQSSGRTRRSFRRQLTDATVVFYGQAPVSLGDVDASRAKSPEDLLKTPITAVAKATYKGFKEYQGVLGGGSRSPGFERGERLLTKLADAEGHHSSDTLHGLRDGLLRNQPRRESRDFLTAYAVAQQLAETEIGIPEEYADYPRTLDGYRGGVIAAVAIRFADVVGEPMLGRAARVIHGTKTPARSLRNVLYGAGASVAGSVLDAVKEITNRALEGVRGAASQAEETIAAVEMWRGQLEEARDGAPYGGPDDAIEAAERAVAHLHHARALISSASQELDSWQRSL